MTSGVAILPQLSMLNHSCFPNCGYFGTVAGTVAVRAVSPIKSGEELCVHYVDLYQTRQARYPHRAQLVLRAFLGVLSS